MIRKNWLPSAVSSRREAPSAVAAEPLIAASGGRSSWLTMPRNSVRVRSRSSSGARSCMVTTTESTSPSAKRIGVTLTSVFTRRPSGTESTISSARTVSAVTNCCAGELGEGYLVSIRTLAGDHLQQLLRGAAGRAQAVDDPPRLLVDPDCGAAPRLEDHHAHRRGLDQRFQVRAGPLLVAVGACVGDRGGRLGLGCEQQQDLFVLAGELSPPSLSPRKKFPTWVPRGASASPACSSARSGRRRSRANGTCRRAHRAVSAVPAGPGGARRAAARRATRQARGAARESGRRRRTRGPAAKSRSQPVPDAAAARRPTDALVIAGVPLG